MNIVQNPIRFGTTLFACLTLGATALAVPGHSVNEQNLVSGGNDGNVLTRALAPGSGADGLRNTLEPVWVASVDAPVLSSPTLADVNGDGVLEMVITSYLPGPNPYGGGLIHVVDLEGNYLPGWPVQTAGPIPGTPVVADLNGDGNMEIVVGCWQRSHVLNAQGNYLSGWPKTGGSSHAPAVYDLNGDGTMQIIYARGSTLEVWNHDGSSFPGWPRTAPDQIGSPAVGDITGDGQVEIVAGTLAGPVGPDPYEVYAWRTDGTIVPGFPVATSGTVKAPVVLGDLSGNGTLDIIATAYHTSNNDYLYAWDGTGTALPGWPVRADYIRMCSPALGDIDGDGSLEVVIGGMRPSPMMERIYAFKADGTEVPGWPVLLEKPGNAGNINNSPIIVELDGQIRIFIKTNNHFFSLNPDGTIVDGYPFHLSDDNASGTHTPAPAILDMNGDGTAEFVFISNSGNVAFFDEDDLFSEAGGFWPMYKRDQWNTGALIADPECVGDITGDGKTGHADLAALLAAYGSVPGDPNWNSAADLNGDDIVDHADLALLLSDYGCGT